MVAVRILPENSKAAVVAIGVSIVGCTLAIVAIDAAFRTSLTTQYLATFAQQPAGLTPMMIGKAAMEELVGRLLLEGGMLTVAGLALRERKIGPWLLLAIILAAQILILLPDLAAPAGVTEWVYDAVRFVGPGVLWGWLFWRHGFVAALLGHTGTHPLLDPALHALLGRPH